MIAWDAHENFLKNMGGSNQFAVEQMNINFVQEVRKQINK